MEVKEVPRPPGVHQYLAFGMQNDGSGFDRAKLWRDAEVVRGFATDTAGLYDEIVEKTKWKDQVSETKDFRTASYHLRYDREGKMKFSSMKTGGHTFGVIPRLDAIVRKLFEKCGIDEETGHAGLYWFSSGDASVGSHRHPRWSARIAIGGDRIMMVDKTPILLQEGDLVVIGPQRHGVPSMPDEEEGSIRIGVQFMPPTESTGSNSHKPKPAATGASKAAAQKREEESTAEALDETNDQEVQSSLENFDVSTLVATLGVEPGQALAALRACQFDVEVAAEVLLTGSFREASSSSRGGSKSAGMREAVREKLQDDNEDEDEDPDLALARRLQAEELDGSADLDELDDHSEERRRSAEDGGWYTLEEFLDHYPDEDQALAEWSAAEQMKGGSAGAIAQWAEYERMLDIDEAERAWDGYGDLMHNNFRREVLNLDMLGPQVLYSIGVGSHTAPSFFEALAHQGIKVLYDFRQTDYRDEIRGCPPAFEVRALRQGCKIRGICYRQKAVGKESAFGVLRHLKSDEVQHILVELVWQAKHKGPTAFLGSEEDWRNDNRLVIANELVAHSHRVEHILPARPSQEPRHSQRPSSSSSIVNNSSNNNNNNDNSHGAAGPGDSSSTGPRIEVHPLDVEPPDFLVQEEAKLKKVAAMRKAGELRRVEKSSVDRSTEAIARRLVEEKQVYDVQSELREAQNQDDLVKAQRKVVRMQIAQSKKEVGLETKKMVGAPKYVLEEARKQHEVWQAKEKAKKEGSSSQSSGLGAWQGAVEKAQQEGLFSQSSGARQGAEGQGLSQSPGTSASSSSCSAPSGKNAAAAAPSSGYAVAPIGQIGSTSAPMATTTSAEASPSSVPSAGGRWKTHKDRSQPSSSGLFTVPESSDRAAEIGAETAPATDATSIADAKAAAAEEANLQPGTAALSTTAKASTADADGEQHQNQHQRRSVGRWARGKPARSGDSGPF
mmetsp:Transcript_7240/g.15972  ORF Transcript_7240/g.15972 Transcript_7240/m.15972 type:complete len:954 (+) Transcript_7240:2-2863(+)